MALARLLYPREADIVMGISHLDSYAAFTGVHMNPPGSGIASRRRKPFVDLNEEPAKRVAGLVGVSMGDQSKEGWLKSLRQRCDALRKAGELLSFIIQCFFSRNLQALLGHLKFLFKLVVLQMGSSWNISSYLCSFAFGFILLDVMESRATRDVGNGISVS